MLFSKVSPFTKVPYLRLTNTYNLARKVERNRIDGAFVECGVWKGGCAAVMAYVARKSTRKIWLFDSFKGLPESTKEDKNKHKISGSLVASPDDCKKVLFNQLKLNKINIVIRKGWFRDVLPKSKPEIGKIALLRTDADWYESTKQCLENLYENVVSGGYVIIDDYGYFSGCKKAVDEFIKGKNIKINKIDGIGIFFQKP
ncbi:hypothetical protein AMJ49_03115 [Parcubacteria bacterium DG_74_2]|nr:MAG: hypothetical protein AMJ49_03115 [Parcubacteria bacterium DG_74_2]